MAKHIAPPATYEQLTPALDLTPEEIELVERVIEKVLKDEEEEEMAKNIVAPATAEEIGRALKVTRKDREIVERVLREIGEYEPEPSPVSTEPTSPGYKVPGRER
jgi:hypothetical protein